MRPLNNVNCVLNRTPLYLSGVISFPQRAIELHISYAQWVPVICGSEYTSLNSVSQLLFKDYQTQGRLKIYIWQEKNHDITNKVQ